MLQGKSVIITGASRGIGRQIALTFASQGANLVINGNDLKQLEQVSKEAQALGSKVVIVPGDISLFETAQRLATECLANFSTIDVLVNNAGTMLRAPFLEVDLQAWQKVMDVNFSGSVYSCRCVLPTMIEKKQGSIINIASVAGKTAHANSTACYGASKAALLSLTQKLALDMGPYNIRVNAIAPGPIATEMTDQWTPEYREKVLAKIPLQRLGKPTDIANTALFLASDLADFITGESINVNGGTYMN